MSGGQSPLNVRRTCDVCGTEFRPIQPNQLRCSHECGVSATTEALQEVYRGVHRKPLDEKSVTRCISDLRDGVTLEDLRARFGAKVVNEAQRRTGLRGSGVRDLATW